MNPKHESTISEAELSSSPNQVEDKKSLTVRIFEKLNQTKADIYLILLRSVLILFVSGFFVVAAIYYGLINP